MHFSFQNVLNMNQNVSCRATYASAPGDGAPFIHKMSFLVYNLVLPDFDILLALLILA